MCAHNAGRMVPSLQTVGSNNYDLLRNLQTRLWPVSSAWRECSFFQKWFSGLVESEIEPHCPSGCHPKAI